MRKRFPFDSTGRRDLRSAAIPDAKSVQVDDHIEKNVSPGGRSSHSAMLPPLRLKRHASNAMLVGAKAAEGGRPLLVAGPQVGFYSPAILHEVAYRGPGVHVRGAAVPGAGIYPIAGRGENYSWSVTTAQGDLADTFAELLCEPDGSRPTLRSNHYVRRDRCVPCAASGSNSRGIPARRTSRPIPARSRTAARSIVQRSVHGPVIARGTVRGKPGRVRACTLVVAQRAPGRARPARRDVRPRHARHASSSARSRRSAARTTGSTPTRSTSPTCSRACTRAGRAGTDSGPADLGHGPLGLARLRLDVRDRAHAAVRAAAAGDRPAERDARLLEQQAGAGLARVRRRLAVRLGAPLRAPERPRVGGRLRGRSAS